MVFLDSLGSPEQVGTPLPLVRLKPENQRLCSSRVRSLFGRACKPVSLAPNVVIIQSRPECRTLAGDPQAVLKPASNEEHAPSTGPWQTKEIPDSLGGFPSF